MDDQEKRYRKDYLGNMIDHNCEKLAAIATQLQAISEVEDPDNIPIAMGYISDAYEISLKISEWYAEWKQLSLDLEGDPSDPTGP